GPGRAAGAVVFVSRGAGGRERPRRPVLWSILSSGGTRSRVYRHARGCARGGVDGPAPDTGDPRTGTRPLSTAGASLYPRWPRRPVSPPDEARRAAVRTSTGRDPARPPYQPGPRRGPPPAPMSARVDPDTMKSVLLRCGDAPIPVTLPPEGAVAVS